MGDVARIDQFVIFINTVNN